MKQPAAIPVIPVVIFTMSILEILLSTGSLVICKIWKICVENQELVAKTLYHNRGDGQGVRLSILSPLFSFLPPHFIHLSPFPLFSPRLLLSPGLPIHCPSSHNRSTDRKKNNNIQVHSATSQLIFQYLQYWYSQYFLESSSICNTVQYWYNQYFPESSRLPETC